MTMYVRSLLIVVVGFFAGSSQMTADPVRLDSSGSFFYPGFAGRSDASLAEFKGGTVDTATYLRYLAARLSKRYLEDLAFDLLLARECEALKIARSAPALARPLAVQRKLDSRRRLDGEAEGRLSCKFANEALRQSRLDALSRYHRGRDAEAIRARFDHRYGVGGQRVRVRQILVSFTATRKRLAASGKAENEKAVVAEAKARAERIHGRIMTGASISSLLDQSDDRTTRRLLAGSESRDKAGFLDGYNYDRYGAAFADAVRSLKVSDVSVPIRTEQGYHLIELEAREVTRFEDVEALVRKEVMTGPAKPAEIAILRSGLFKKYELVLPR